jgi:hypothetical protein
MYGWFSKEVKKKRPKSAAVKTGRTRKLTKKQVKTKAKIEARKLKPVAGSFRLTGRVIKDFRQHWKPLGGIVLVYLILNIIFASGISNISATFDNIKTDLNRRRRARIVARGRRVWQFGRQCRRQQFQYRLGPAKHVIRAGEPGHYLGPAAPAFRPSHHCQTGLLPLNGAPNPVFAGDFRNNYPADADNPWRGDINFCRHQRTDKYGRGHGLYNHSVYIAGGLVYIYGQRFDIRVYIVTLPDMQPRLALRSAKDLVRFRRWPVIRKVMFLPIFIVAVMGVIIVPLILFAQAIVPAVFYLLSMLAILFAHAYLYSLYRELLE